MTGRKWNTALGFYQNDAAATHALKKLRKKGFKRSLSIHRSNLNELSVHYFGISKAILSFLLISIATTAVFVLVPGFTGALLCSLAFCIWLLFAVHRYRVNSKMINQYKNDVLKGETLVIAQVRDCDVRGALNLLRMVESDHPITFLIRLSSSEELESEQSLIAGYFKEPFREPLTPDQLQEKAMELATVLKDVSEEKTERHLLKYRLRKRSYILERIRCHLAEAEYIEQTVTLSGSWLLDNDYIIQENMREIERSLPFKYYQQLPKVIHGPIATLPRIYALAIALIEATANRLTEENILAFLKSFQSITPLTIGELWAFPLMLRLHLIERIQSLAMLLDGRLREGELARYWGNRLLTAARRHPERLMPFIKALKTEELNPSSHFAEELLEHLFDEDSALIPLKSWIETKHSKTLSEIIQAEQKQETLNEVAFSSAVISLISLRQLSWREIFEDTSRVDAILRDDPIDVYRQMNFATRDNYRRAVEILARRSPYSESEVAITAVEMARQGITEVARHVGYYLIDKGLENLEKKLGFSPSKLQILQRFLLNYPSFVYLGSIALITAFIELFLVHFSIQSGASVWQTIFFIGLSLFPASEIGVEFMHLVVPCFLPPHVLPKMNFENGVLEKDKTLVVIPTMLASKKSCQASLNQLEIHYLANSDPALKFGLLFDYADARAPVMQEDAELLEDALKGMKTLSEKYGKRLFFLFLRPRVWSESECVFIGWERKRGKLESLNRFLTDLNYPGDILKFGEREDLKNTRFVITLDGDTQLPKGKAIQLIETIAHPLNLVRLNEAKTIERGYTIIQPRVSTDVSQPCETFFEKIYSDVVGINPYTGASSDIYQDLMHEGSYHGKCIYDVSAFDEILSNRFPEDHLLSHDLIEGAYVRAAYASDISLFDSFPQNYMAWSMRQHRWMRGDWQIVDWLFSKVPSFSQEKKSNPSSWINRWKIFNNFRRALSPPMVLVLMISSWFITPTIIALNGVILAYFLLPTISLLLSNLQKYIYSFTSSLSQILLSILKMAISMCLLPHQAYLSIDALARVIYRRCISHKFLLEWPLNTCRSPSKEHSKFLCRLLFISAFAAILNVLVAYMNPAHLSYAAPFCFLWGLTPLVVFILDNPRFIRKDPLHQISSEDRVFLHRAARRTWRYFDDFVSDESHWLPPDNFQVSLKVELAKRTSPTNIGLWMLGVISAYDLKYITCDEVLKSINATFETLQKLETYQGHLLNWYDTSTLKPLHPRYISTVDNGNFLSSLWTLQQAVKELITKPVLPPNLFEGLSDTFNVLCEEIKSSSNGPLSQLQSLLLSSSSHIPTLISFIRSALSIVHSLPLEGGEAHYWIKQLEKELNGWNECSKRYLEWAEIAAELASSDLEALDKDLNSAIKGELQTPHSLQSLASGSLSSLLMPLIDSMLAKQNLQPNAIGWAQRLKEALHKAQWFAGEKMEFAYAILSEAEKISESTKMQFLYNPERKLFSIGFNVEDCKLDSSFYDLIASEARVASLVSIAKGDVPLEHWWSLGRPYRIIKGRKILVSWGGTMFEYLMPLLYTKYYPDSLLGNAYQNAVFFQMLYAKKRGIPWGISEAAFSEIDVHKIYQYRSFGVPELGFKRGLDKDLVVSPYSTVLALSIDPFNAVKNLKTLKDGLAGLYATHGFYESIDYSRQKGPEGERGIITYAFMAHHQGMSLLGLNNALNHDIMQNRFHGDPRIRGVESLLYEQVPVHPPLSQGYKRESPTSRLIPFSHLPMMGVLNTPHTSTPKVNLLSNGAYSVMLTNTGGGYSKWNDIEITRWRSDTTCDAMGSYFYVKDVDTKEFWSSTYQPTFTKGNKFHVKFKTDKVEFLRRDHFIETKTEITVSPQDNTEIRLFTIANLSNGTRHIELTSFSELSLAPHRTDRAHPAFNKLFIQTESIPDLQGIIAFRRLRSDADQPVFAAHLVISNQMTKEPFQFETDRSLFIGRGNTLASPQAMGGELSNSEGYVLDPIFSLRRRIFLTAGERVQIAFITTVAKDRETLIATMKKYSDINASHLSFEMAWTHAQLDLRHLKIHQEEAQLFQRLASHVLFPHRELRISRLRLQKNCLPKSRLWAYSISGDLPILAVSIADLHEVDLVKQVLTAHAFWRLRGLIVDLVILNEEISTYEQPLHVQLDHIIRSLTHGIEPFQPGGVFLINTDQIPDEDLQLILSAASVHLVSARGFLRQHLASHIEPTHYPSRLVIDKRNQEGPSNPLPFLELQYFNGLGGFTNDGKEYVIYLGPHAHTPAPWINVLSNPQFGTIVTEAGLGMTWYGNSQTNRLTPWSNDPLLNPICDALYIRDDVRGVFWTITPSPIRELDAYRIRHAQGYTRFEHNSHGIEQNLIVFVPVDDAAGLPLRIQKLTLLNTSSIKRQLSIFSYSELVLGADREETQMHVVTSWDLESQGLFARNCFSCDYPNHVAFVSSNLPIRSFTGNRTEFIGRNHHLASPAALKRKALSDETGAGFDPCAALQLSIELEPREQKEIIFVLGFAENVEKARELIARSKDPHWIESIFTKTLKRWDDLLETIQVECQEPFVNFSLNRWLLYQNVSCRLWGRSGFYQSSGAFGFRDQLQDVMALLHTAPDLARKQILEAASRQFIEGDVQHWWLPPLNNGVRTRISDDLLWLPFATAQYVRVTKDRSILKEVIPFIEGDLLKEGQMEHFFTPKISNQSGTLLEHCRRAIQKGVTAGPSGLPLIGSGDWNDGMNHVGTEGKGESIWLGFFLIHVLHDFAFLLSENGQPGAETGLIAQAKKLEGMIEKNGWDGEWYLRAYMDDGTPLGSKNNEEDKIDSLSQSWAVISGAGDRERSLLALHSAEKYLVRQEDKLVLLLTPPFDKTPLNPGYIKGYPPGVRENGGQYTHGSLWMALGFARLKEGDKAAELLKLMHPVSHTLDMEALNRYKIEPYVTAGDVYALEGKFGRGGWSWYTGSAGWMYRIWLEEIFGFHLRGDILELDPVLPKAWETAKLHFKFGSSTYAITYENREHLSQGSVAIELDGRQLEGNQLNLIDDGKEHLVIARIVKLSAP